MKQKKEHEVQVVNETKQATLAFKISQVQQEIGKFLKDTQGYNYKYFDINQIIEKLRPQETKHRVSITMPLVTIYQVGFKPTLGMSLRVTDLDSESYEEYQFPFPEVNDPQDLGGWVTYMRRYALVSFFNLQAEDNDAANVKKATTKMSPSSFKAAPTSDYQVEYNQHADKNGELPW